MAAMDHSKVKERCDKCGKITYVYSDVVYDDKCKCNRIIKICRECYDSDRYGIKS